MSWLKRHRYKVQSLTQALADARRRKIRRKSVVLTFDDGFTDFLKNALPVLRQYQWPATLFVVAGRVSGTSQWQSNELPLLTWHQIRDIADMGFEIGSHGLYHRDLTTLSDKELEIEVNISKKFIEDHAADSVNAFSYPWGICHLREEEAVRKAGYNCAVAVGSRQENSPAINQFCLQRKTMCRDDCLADFAYKLGAHSRVYMKTRQILHKIVHSTGKSSKEVTV